MLVRIRLIKALVQRNCHFIKFQEGNFGGINDQENITQLTQIVASIKKNQKIIKNQLSRQKNQEKTPQQQIRQRRVGQQQTTQSNRQQLPYEIQTIEKDYWAQDETFEQLLIDLMCKKKVFPERIRQKQFYKALNLDKNYTKNPEDNIDALQKLAQIKTNNDSTKKNKKKRKYTQNKGYYQPQAFRKYSDTSIAWSNIQTRKKVSPLFKRVMMKSAGCLRKFQIQADLTYLDSLNKLEIRMEEKQRQFKEINAKKKIKFNSQKYTKKVADNYLLGLKIIQYEKCNICETVFNKNQLVQMCQCNHLFCPYCLKAYCQIKLSRFQELQCPQEDCSGIIRQESSFYKGFSSKQKRKYQKIHKFYEVSKDASLRICPGQKCQGIIKVIEEEPSVCSVCRKQYCPKCLYQKHLGDCEVNQLLHYEQKLKLKRCPNCQSYIQKNKGCNHMTCRCKYQFCYVCTQKWAKNHRCQSLRQTNIPNLAGERNLVRIEAIQQRQSSCCENFRQIMFNMLRQSFLFLVLIVYFSIMVIPYLTCIAVLSFVYTASCLGEAIFFQFCEMVTEMWSDNRMFTLLLAIIFYPLTLIIITYFVMIGQAWIYPRQRDFCEFLALYNWIKLMCWSKFFNWLWN